MVLVAVVVLSFHLVSLRRLGPDKEFGADITMKPMLQSKRRIDGKDEVKRDQRSMITMGSYEYL